MKGKFIFAVLLVFGLSLLIMVFKTDEPPSEIKDTESKFLPQRDDSVDVEPKTRPPQEKTVEPKPMSPETTYTGPEKPSVRAQTEQSILSSSEDRRTWRDCLKEEPPPVEANYEDWARSQSREAPTVHWSNIRFNTPEGNEQRLRFLIDDGAQELPLPRLQLFSVDSEGNPDEILKQEDMSYEQASQEIPQWIGQGEKIFEEKSLTLYLDDGEVSIETENGKTRSMTVTRGANVLVCSLRATQPDSRCACKTPEPEY